MCMHMYNERAARSDWLRGRATMIEMSYSVVKALFHTIVTDATEREVLRREPTTTQAAAQELGCKRHRAYSSTRVHDSV